MKTEKILTLVIVLMMSLTPVTGMTFNDNANDSIVDPIVPMTSTMVYGWVNDTGSNPMPGTSVIFRDTDTEGIIFSTSTNATGYYNITINVTYDGHIFEMYGVNNVAYLYQNYVGFNEGSNREISFDLNMAPARDCSLEGYITDSLTGMPIAGINITASGNSYLNSTQTNATGYYHMGFIPDQYSMGPDVDGYEDWVEQFYLNSGDNSWRNITLEPINSTLKGYVLSSGGPLDNAQISITDPWGGAWSGIRYEAWTDATGYYEINLTQGSKPVGFSADGFLSISRAVELKFDEISWLNVTMPDAPPDDFIVSGYITDLNTGDPISGVVYLNNANRSWFNQTLVNATTGYYEISGPSEELTLSAQSYWGHYGNSTTINPMPSDVLTQDMVLTNDTDWTTIQGHVEFDSMLITGAQITIYHGNNNWQTSTDGLGDYSINVPSGYIQMVCYYRPMDGTLGSEMDSTFMTTPANGNVWKNYSLSRLSLDSILTGTIEDSMSGLPVENALIYMGNALPGMENTFETGGMTDFKGEYEILAPSGQFNTMVLAEGYEMIMDTVDTSSAEWNWDNATLDPMTDTITIMGFVRDMDTSQSIIGLEPTASGNDWMVWGNAEAGGYYEIEVPVGEVSLRIEPDSYGYYSPSGFGFYAESGVDIWFNVSLRSRPLSIIVRGSVQESDSSLVAGINVTAEVGSREFTTITDAGGQYSLQVPSGRINIRARDPGYGAKDIFYDWFNQEWENQQVDLTADPTNATISNIISDWAYDEDGDGFFDWLYVNVTLNVSGQGRFDLQGGLMPTKYMSGDGGMGGSSSIYTDNESAFDPGMRVIQLAFPGASIRASEMNGYYVDLEIREESQNWNSVDRFGYSTTSNYTWDQFEKPDISLVNMPFEYFPVDTDFDGLYNLLLFNVTVDVKAPGTYSVFTMLQSMAPNRDDSELGMQMTTEELEAGVQTISMSYSGSNIRNGGYHLGAMTVMLFNGSIDMDNGKMQDSGICYIPMDYRQFQYYNIDSFVNGTVMDTGGAPLSDITVGIYNITSKTWNDTTTDGAGYYELGGWNGEWLLYMNDDNDDTSVYQSNMTVLQMLSNDTQVIDRNLEYTIPDQIIRTITFTDWNTTRMEETIYIESDNETIRFEMDRDQFGNGDGFMSESETNTLMSFVGSEVQWDPNTNETMLIDNIKYDMDGGTNSVDLGIVGSYTTKERVYIHQIANYTASSSIPGATDHYLELNVTYDNVNVDLFSGGNVSLLCYIQLPGMWGHVSAIQTNVSISGTNYVTINPGGDPNLGDNDQTEWINITAQDGQPVTTGNLAGSITLDGNTQHFGVTVTVYNITTDAIVASGVTDANGQYHIHGIDAWQYNVTASKPGYVSDYTEPVTITAGGTTYVDLTLYSYPPTIYHTQVVFNLENNTAPIPIFVQVLDDGSVGEVTMWMTDVHGVQTVTSMDAMDATNFMATIPSQTIPGTLTYYFMANDTAGNSANTTSSLNIINVIELASPLMTVAIDPSSTEYGGYTNISAIISDDHSPNVSVWINITYPGGGTYNHSFYGDGLFFVNDTYLDLGTYDYTIWTNDSFGNINYTSGTFVVADTLRPIISSISVSPATQEIESAVNISADIVDVSGIDQVFIEIIDPNSTMTNVSMSNVAGNSYYWQDNYNIVGTYDYTIWAIDNNGLVNYTIGSFLIQDTNAPSLINPVTIPSVQEAGDSVVVGAEITDLSGIEGAWLEIVDPDGDMTNTSMTLGTGDYYTVEDNYTVIGVYDFTIWTKDNNGLINSVSGNFTIEDTLFANISSKIITPTSPELGEVINFTAEISDISGIGWVNLLLENGTAEIWNVTLDGNNTHYWYEFILLEQGTYHLTMWVEDMANNTNKASLIFMVQDTTSPTFTGGMAIPHTQEFGEDIRLSIDAVDASGIEAVCIYILYPDDTFINVTASLTRAEYYYILEIDSIGTYSYTFWIDDMSGNTASVSGTFIGRDTIDPIANAGPSQNVLVRTLVNLDASRSSDNNDIIEYFWSFNDNGLIRRYGEIANYTFNTTGNYEITLVVTDPSGNEDTSITWVNVSAITGTGTVTGAILDTDGSPIIGVRVYVEDYPSIVNTTDDWGVYILENVPTGSQTIIAGKDGFIREIMNITVLQDQITSLDMTLEPLAGSTPVNDDTSNDGESAGFFILIILLVVAALVGYFLATRKKGEVPPPVEENGTIIDEIFFMYNDGRLIKHFTRRLKPDMDEDILSSMLVAVQEFVKDSFGGDEGALDEMKFGRFQALMGRGEHIIIAAVIIGDETQPFKPQISKCIADIEEKYEEQLAKWDGDVTSIKGSFKYVVDLIDGHYEEK